MIAGPIVLVNAHHYPGPALWQGIMLCLMPLWIWLSDKKRLDFKGASILYAAVGVVLFIIIVSCT